MIFIIKFTLLQAAFTTNTESLVDELNEKFSKDPKNFILVHYSTYLDASNSGNPIVPAVRFDPLSLPPWKPPLGIILYDIDKTEILASWKAGAKPDFDFNVKRSYPNMDPLKNLELQDLRLLQGKNFKTKNIKPA